VLRLLDETARTGFGIERQGGGRGRAARRPNVLAAHIS
jgi:hypothetical protein